jgi:hypothetical protein
MKANFVNAVFFPNMIAPFKGIMCAAARSR